jgi:hypothetical protein
MSVEQKTAKKVEDSGTKINVEVVVEDILSKGVKYKNSRSPIAISEEYRQSIGFLSELTRCEISQIVNNILSDYFDDEDTASRLSAFAKSKYKERMQRFKL